MYPQIFFIDILNCYTNISELKRFIVILKTYISTALLIYGKQKLR